MLMPLMGERFPPRDAAHRKAMVSQVTASMARTLKPMGCWVPWPAINACLLGKVVLPRGSKELAMIPVDSHSFELTARKPVDGVGGVGEVVCEDCVGSLI